MPFEASAKKGSEEGLHMPEISRTSDRMFYAYILRSEQNPERFYYGYSLDLKARLKAHNQGDNVSTKTGIPWNLAWYGGFQSESAASDFERYLKTASGKAFARKRLLRT
jgi:predicted GIY-YIG superfamily endonuclease